MPSPIFIAAAVAGGAYALAHLGSAKTPPEPTPGPMPEPVKEPVPTSPAYSGDAGWAPVKTATGSPVAGTPPAGATGDTDTAPTAPPSIAVGEPNPTAGTDSLDCPKGVYCPSSPSLAGTNPGSTSPQQVNYSLLAAARSGASFYF